MFKHVQAACATCAPWGFTFLRLMVGAILINHGFPKLFGETAQMLAFFESTILPFPAFMLWLAGVLEFFGGIALLLGAATRFISTMLVLEFLVIVLFVKLRVGFSAMEFDLLLLASLYALASVGAGKWSIDWLIARRKNPEGKDAQSQQASKHASQTHSSK